MERKLSHITESKNVENQTIIKGHLVGNGSGIPVKDLTIEVYDYSKVIKKPLAVTKCDEQGGFWTKVNFDDLQHLFPKQDPKIFFTVRAGKQRLYSSKNEAATILKPHTMQISIKLPKAINRNKTMTVPDADLRELIIITGVNKTSVNTYLSRLKKQGISSLKTLLDNRGKINPDSTGLSQESCTVLLTLGKLSTLTQSISLKQKLVNKDITSIQEIARKPVKAIEKKLGKLNKSDKKELLALYQRAQSATNQITHYSVLQQRQRSPDAGWHMTVDVVHKPEDDKTCHICKGCDNIFSPKAYLFDLLDLIWYRWSITPAILEKILLQSIDDINCETGFAMLPQVELSAKVLENYLGTNKIPVTDSVLKNNYQDAWLTLLGIKKSTLNTITTPANANYNTPGLTILQRLKLLILSTKPELKTLQSIVNILGESNHTDLKNLSANYRDTTGQFMGRLSQTHRNLILIYRDTLIKKTNQDVLALQNKLFIDLKMGACHKTNRITQLILSLQSFILSIRTGEIANIARSDLPENIINFQDLIALPVEEGQWKWLKSYHRWASALYAVLYTENVLLPKMNGGSDRFQEAVERLQGPMTPKKARQIYLDFRFPKYSDEQTFQDILLSLYDDEQINVPHHHLLRLFMRPPHENALIELSDWINKLALLADQAISDFIDETGWIFLITLFEEIELKFYLPLLTAWSLNQSGEYAAAHDWYRQLYDPEKTTTERLVFDFHGFFSDASLYSSEWFNGGLDPEEIAQRRKGVYLRHTILAMVKNVIEWADHEYSLATPMSLDRARDLYELAQRILQSPDLADHCGQSIRDLEKRIIISMRRKPTFDKNKLKDALKDMYTINDRNILDKAIDECEVYLSTPPDSGDIDPIEKIIKRAVKKDRTARNVPISMSKEIVSKRLMLEKLENDYFYSGSFSKSILETNNQQAIEHHIESYNTPIYSGTYHMDHGLNNEEWTFSNYEETPVYSSLSFCVPPNPLLQAYNFYIETNLLKLRNCLNFAGYPTESELLSEQTVTNFLDNISDDVQIQPQTDSLISGTTNQPRYRYSFLIEKTRQCIEIAQRLGQALLQAHEKKDSETFAQLQANQAIELAKATISLKQLGVREAEHGVDFAGLQEDRAGFQMDWWQTRIEEGFLSPNEMAGIGLMLGSAALQATAAIVQGIGAIIAFFGAGAAGTVGGAIAGGGAGGAAGGAPAVPGAVGGGSSGAAVGFSVGAGLAAAIPGTAGALNSAAGALGTLGSASLTVAGFERRWEEWNLQRDLANFDLQLANLQKSLATDQLFIANKELQISNLHQTQAQEVLEFLQIKFSNENLYRWMIQTLKQNYRIMMQVSTALARMAQSALAFEHQEKIQIILGDYWSFNQTSFAANELSETQKESGLLGSERLLTDVAKLDAYKLQTDKRKLQLSKTISMAQLMPGDLAQLRSSGKVTFNTLLQWFDRDFPGHYLRLIKNIRVSVLALVPPVEGIHAMLFNSGESTVVIKNGLEFEKKRALRQFGESIALDSPFNDTGLFVLDYHDPLFLPFEGLGVETQWTFELPHMSNKFNYDTIVDVLFTIEYTALHDPLYADFIRNKIGDTMNQDLILDLHNQFPDPWYHFKNPTPNSMLESSQSIQITLPQQMLPSYFKKGQSDVVTNHLTVIVLGDFNDLTSSEETQLKNAFTISKGTQLFTTDPNAPSGHQQFTTSQMDANNNFVLFSTRNAGQPNGTMFSPFYPAGDWTINVNAIQFQNGTLLSRLANIILVVTIDGKLL